MFWPYEARGEYFDITDPSHVVRGSISIGGARVHESGFFVSNTCIGCGSCLPACPQSCIDVAQAPAVIDQGRCLHCGACAEACPDGAVERRW